MSSSIRLFVGNLPDRVNENELRTAFSSFGEITALDIKNKPSVDNDKKLFAFITLVASNYDIESCIKHFTNEDFNGTRLYVTRARESFLERLQREREQAQRKEIEKNETLNVKVTSKPLNVNLHKQTNKRKFEKNIEIQENGKKSKKKFEKEHYKSIPEPIIDSIQNTENSISGYGSKYDDKDDKKENSDKKRLESMRKKRQEFNEKKMIVKTGLTHIDKAPNKKIIFSDGDDNNEVRAHNGLSINNHVSINIDNNRKINLFDEGDDSDNEVNFEVKKQFEGKQGQKVLDLQSRYKADKRFVLDERFIEDNKSDEEPAQKDNNESVELGQEDEKYKQLNILQDVLGLPIKIKQNHEPNKQTKSKLGMLRFDPTQPEHAKFLAPVEKKHEQSKKIKKKKTKETPEEEETQIQQETREIEKVEVSKEQFYKVTDTLKETLEQPSSFSLRSLFTKETESEENGEVPCSEETYESTVPLSAKSKKVKNPFDPGEKNPFVYDSSDSENEEESKVEKEAPQICEPKPIWREKLFFSDTDNRLSDGLSYFTQSNYEKAHKDRRELKSVMKKRVYNKERKNQMFQKKIGGRRKSNKKSFRKK